MANLRYVVKSRAAQKIYAFYSNVARKYRHTYDRDDLKRNVRDSLFSIYGIERTLMRREPTIARWIERGYFMANTDKWYFAYTFDGNTITVVDVCHAQNMHEHHKA